MVVGERSYMNPLHTRPAERVWCRWSRMAVIGSAAGLLIGVPAQARAQIGQLVSPGPLAKAHASLEGASNCQKCHAPGKKVTADLCLSCHKPVAERIRAKKGVHRDVTTECTRCHVEHAGVDAELRPFNLASFDHGRDAAYALEGRHAAVAKDCAKCHTSRSYLTLSPACTTCHKDVHNGTLGPSCPTCHPMAQAFKDAKTRFDHAKSAFALEGAHQRVACEKCHVNKVYKGVKFANCTDCHKNPHRQISVADCRSCHTLETWKTQKLDHSKTAFALKGSHAQVPCVKCHVKPPVQAALKFDRCAACHQDPHKGTFTQDCGACHNEVRFGRAAFDHTKNTKFPLTGKHAPLDCVKCHKTVAPGAPTAARVVDFRGLSVACASCHADVHKGELGKACAACHTSTSFRISNYVHSRSPEFFAGEHRSVPCANCHVPQPPGPPRKTGVALDGWKFKNVSMACASCHVDVHLGQVGTACEACHAIDAAKFALVRFAHTKTSYPLTGRHASVECRKCHKPETGSFPAGRGTAVRLKGLATTCVSCHADQHLGQLGTGCETCHTTATFKVTAYTHAKTSAPLMVGGHAALKCDACHKSQHGQFPAGVGTTIGYKVGLACSNCHADEHQGALGKTCEMCHTPVEWKTISRAFHKTASFKLEGQHLIVDCSSCHWNGVIRGTPTRCYDCHWIRRQDDRYKTNLGAACENCHRPTTWTAVNWSHSAATGVALSPVHRALGCEGCHKGGNFKAGGVTCYSCHASDYQATKAPNHAAAGFPMTCEVCHLGSHTAWSQASFKHSTFQLAGTHASQSCDACHKNGVYKGTPNTCYGCHKPDYDKTTSPNHAAAGFPVTCESCHGASASTWKTGFNHNATFPLVGVHATQACAACHINNVYKGTPNTCYGCHKSNYDRTTNPNHAAAGFSTTCDACHNASSAGWTSSFSHAATYPLVGAHATAACAACHVNNVFKGTSRDCYGCHKTDYDKTTKPNHAAAGFSTTCDTCHSASTAAWTSSFNHNQYFVLAGRHLTAACTDCHKNNVYKGTPTTCYPCHTTDYTGSRNPNHVAAGFPTTCDTCHKFADASWAQGTFNHTWFPITSGRHAGNACSACHQNSSNYKVFTCVTCHDKARTDSQHSGRSGYRYDSAACYSCHPRGSAD